jgi:hypothetical protein
MNSPIEAVCTFRATNVRQPAIDLRKHESGRLPQSQHDRSHGWASVALQKDLFFDLGINEVRVKQSLPSERPF